MREADSITRAESTGAPDEELIQRHLSLARAQGDAYADALTAFAAMEQVEPIEQRVGDYRVTCLVSQPADPPTSGPDSDGTDVRLCIFVRDVGDGRFVPCLRIRATVVDATGSRHGPREQPLVWHPLLYHYGSNWRLSSSPPHRFLVAVQPPEFQACGDGPPPRFDPGAEFELPIGSSTRDIRSNRG